MELLYSPDLILQYTLCLTIRELVLLLFVCCQLGYYFGKTRMFQHQSSNPSSDALPLFCLPCSKNLQNPQNAEQPKNKEEQAYQQSLELIKSNSNIASTQSSDQNNQSINLPSQQLTAPKSEDELSRDFLSEKINVEGKKIQSRAIFHMTFEKAENPKFIRKIQKHEIITDYELPQTNTTNAQIIPFNSKKFYEITDDNSILEISTYENIRLQKFPIIQRKLIKTHQFNHFDEKASVAIPMSASLCQNGKFNKFFKNQRKIGEGAFGVVYSVMNIFQGKEYAVKKLFIKSGLGKNTMQTILNESIKQVNIISQYSHPNIIRFYTCWLQIANLNESITFNKMHFRSLQQIENDYSSLQPSVQLNFRKKKSVEDFIEVSYISSQANSGFAFQSQNRDTSSHRNHADGSPSDCQIVSTIEGQNCKQSLQNQHHVSEFVPVFALYIQMELCRQGSLDKYLQRRKYINRNFAFVVINQLLHGAQYLHSNGLVHRDLKPGNILINKKQRLVKIGDFGLSTKINEDIQYGKIGTPSYMAPQILQKRPLRKEELHLIDVYSLGVIYFELLNMFNSSTKHEKLQKINKLKEGRVDLHQDFALQKKLIKLMTKSFNRLSIKEIFARKEYHELAQIIHKDTEILNSWESISGLQENEDGKK